MCVCVGVLSMEPRTSGRQMLYYGPLFPVQYPGLTHFVDKESGVRKGEWLSVICRYSVIECMTLAFPWKGGFKGSFLPSSFSEFSGLNLMLCWEGMTSSRSKVFQENGPLGIPALLRMLEASTGSSCFLWLVKFILNSFLT